MREVSFVLTFESAPSQRFFLRINIPPVPRSLPQIYQRCHPDMDSRQKSLDQPRRLKRTASVPAVSAKGKLRKLVYSPEESPLVIDEK